MANMYQNCKDANTLSAVSLLAAELQETSFISLRKGGKTALYPTIGKGTEDDDSVRLWHIALFEVAQIVGYQDWAARDQMEMIACLHHGECIGPIDDYTTLFRANFGVRGHPRCYSIVQDLVTGTRVIGIPEWRDITSRFLPCPMQDDDEEEEM